MGKKADLLEFISTRKPHIIHYTYVLKLGYHQSSLIMKQFLVILITISIEMTEIVMAV